MEVAFSDTRYAFVFNEDENDEQAQKKPDADILIHFLAEKIKQIVNKVS